MVMHEMAERLSLRSLHIILLMRGRTGSSLASLTPAWASWGQIRFAERHYSTLVPLVSFVSTL